MPKYLVTLQSGRDFVMTHEGDVEDLAWCANEEACLMDDYLTDVELIE